MDEGDDWEDPSKAKDHIGAFELSLFLRDIDDGKARLTPETDPSSEFGHVAYDVRGGQWDGWRIVIFKDGWGVSWDYVELVLAPDGRSLTPFEFETSHDGTYCRCCSVFLRYYSPSDRDLKRHWSMR